MSHESKLDLMRRARECGFYVTLLFVCTDDPLINVARVNARVQRGGHSVPEGRIVARYGRAMQNLFKAVAICDQTKLFDNSTIEGSWSSYVELNCSPSLEEPASANFKNVGRNRISIATLKRAPLLPQWINRFLYQFEADRELMKSVLILARPWQVLEGL